MKKLYILVLAIAMLFSGVKYVEAQWRFDGACSCCSRCCNCPEPYCGEIGNGWQCLTRTQWLNNCYWNQAGIIISGPGYNCPLGYSCHQVPSTNACGNSCSEVLLPSPPPSPSPPALTCTGLSANVECVPIGGQVTVTASGSNIGHVDFYVNGTAETDRVYDQSSPFQVTVSQTRNPERTDVRVEAYARDDQVNATGTAGHTYCGTLRTNVCEPVCEDVNPAAPVLLSVGTPLVQTPQTIATSADLVSVNLDWSHTDFGLNCAGNVDSYRLYVSTSNPPATQVGGTIPSGTTIYNGYQASVGRTYYWRVSATNGGATAMSETYHFTIYGKTSGTVYVDPTNTCAGSGSNLGGGVAATLAGRPPVTVGANGAYTIYAPNGTYATLSISGYGADYLCSTGCAQQCDTATTIQVSSSPPNHNFYFTQKLDPWWQAVGASVYAGGEGAGTNIASSIPATASQPYLVIPPVGGTDAAVVRKSGSVNVGSGSVSTSGYSAVSTYQGKILDFEYWSVAFGLPLIPVEYTSGDILPEPPGGSDYYYMAPSTQAIIDTPWVVGNTESYVVMVDGDLRINADITVAQGGYLALIVSGDVTVDPDVQNLQGIYIMDQNFITETDSPGSDDPQLDVRGTVIAWGTVDLNRDLGLANINIPAEKFTYRPDLIVNMPVIMTDFSIAWKEEYPGAFE